MEARGSGEFEIRLLGPVEVRRGGAPAQLGGPRQRRLLALLATRPGSRLSPARLIDELWAGEPPEGAEVTLRSYVSRLRKALDGAALVSTTSDGYALEVDPAAVDGVRFERLVRDGDDAARRRSARRARERFATALELWRGDPFGDLGGEGALRLEADRLGELRLHALEGRLDAELAVGLAAQLVDELEALVASHPFHEPFWRQLMLALYRAGRQADALAAYQRARRILDEQLGIDPGPALREVEGAILRQEVPPVEAAAPVASLPAPLTSFVGREAEAGAVDELLRGVRLVTLTGVGGVGKTRLALEVARRAVPDLPDGVAFVDLSPLADPALLDGHVASAFELREVAGQAAVERLVAHLGGRETLLVLDNCEHLLEAAAALVARLLEGAPGLRILATSREVLGVPGEVDYPVPPLRLAAGEDAAAAAASEAVRLFVERARAARPDLPDDPATLATIATICRELDGLPLGIELAAARAKALTPGEIADRLSDRFRFLVSWRRLTPARHRTLREAMDWSYELLSEVDQELLARLSVFAGGCTIEAVAAVCLDGDEALALERIERLVNASLVVPELEVDGELRFRLLETVRQYAAERLGAETEALRRRHAEHFASVARAAAEPIRRGTGGEPWMARLGRERDNVRAALTWAHAAGAAAIELEIVGALWWFWWIRGEISEGRSRLEAAIHAAGPLAAPGAADPEAWAERTPLAGALAGAAGLAWVQGDLSAAERHASLARELYAGLGDVASEAATLNTLGLVALGRLDLEEAERRFEASRALHLRVDDEQRTARAAVAVDNLGSVSVERGDLAEARARYEAARRMYADDANRGGLAMTDLHLGIVALEDGRTDEAAALLRDALAAYRERGFVQYMIEALEGAAGVANRRGHPADAACFLGAADRLRLRTGNPTVRFMRRIHEREATAARDALGPEEATRATERGRDDPDAAVERALRLLAN